MCVNCGWIEGIAGGPTPKCTSTPACVAPGPVTTATVPLVVTECVLQLSEGLTVLEESLTTGSRRTWLRERGVTPPFHPLPLGIVGIASYVTLGVVFSFAHT